MESTHYPFKTVGQALSYFNNCNPARQKYLNLIEPEFGNKPAFADFSGNSPRDLWASICAAINEVLKLTPYEGREIFKLRHLGDRSTHKAKEDIARDLGLPLYIVRKYLRQIEEELEAELIYREILPPKEEEKLA